MNVLQIIAKYIMVGLGNSQMEQLRMVFRVLLVNLIIWVTILQNADHLELEPLVEVGVFTAVPTLNIGLPDIVFNTPFAPCKGGNFFMDFWTHQQLSSLTTSVVHVQSRPSGYPDSAIAVYTLM